MKELCTLLFVCLLSGQARGQADTNRPPTFQEKIETLKEVCIGLYAEIPLIRIPVTAIEYVDIPATWLGYPCGAWEQFGVVYILPPIEGVEGIHPLPGNTFRILRVTVVDRVTGVAREVRIACIQPTVPYFADLLRQLRYYDKAVELVGWRDYDLKPKRYTYLDGERRRLYEQIGEHGFEDPKTMSLWVAYHQKLKASLGRKEKLKLRRKTKEAAAGSGGP